MIQAIPLNPRLVQEWNYSFEMRYERHIVSQSMGRARVKIFLDKGALKNFLEYYIGEPPSQERQELFLQELFPVVLLRFEVRHDDNTIGKLSSGERLVSDLTFVCRRELHKNLDGREGKCSGLKQYSGFLKGECRGNALRAYICIGGHFMGRLVVEFVF